MNFRISFDCTQSPEALVDTLFPSTCSSAAQLFLMASLCDVFHASTNLIFLSIRARNSFINGRINVLADKLSEQFWKRIHQGLPPGSGRGHRRSRRSRPRQIRLFSAMTSLDDYASPVCIPVPLIDVSLDFAVLAKPLLVSLAVEGGSRFYYRFLL